MEEEIIADLELSYLRVELINTSGCPPVIIANDRQLQNFVCFVQKSDSTRLCVTCKAKAENPNEAAFDLNKSPADPCTDEEEENSFDNETIFENKTLLKPNFEICAMKHNFDYQVIKMDRQLWYVRCADNACNWGVRKECLKDSTYFMIKKYVGKHTCAPSSKTKAGKTASAKTIDSLIMHKYEGVKEGPKCNDIIKIMRSDHDVRSQNL
ncbi:hypothetical protein F2Q70_00034791 [Brassica cretica]|uniref:Transposase MuDR plant domain-containing protein n=1 Tax=Brassica cretica TaxID=69181 RepID=A0A8S9JQV6_BRACR|nr:hypothetical protein F2Q70_00034791 [Brassica cretica]